MKIKLLNISLLLFITTTFCFSSILTSPRFYGTTNQKPKGESQYNAGIDCKDILDSRGYVHNGVYWIDPDGINSGNSPFRAYCDMKIDGGGWTLVVGISGADNNHVKADAVNADNLVSIDAKGKFSDLVINQIISNDGYIRIEIESGASKEFWQVGSGTSIGYGFSSINSCDENYINKGWLIYSQLELNPTTIQTTAGECSGSNGYGGGLSPSGDNIKYNTRSRNGMYSNGRSATNGRLWVRRR